MGRLRDKGFEGRGERDDTQPVSASNPLEQIVAAYGQNRDRHFAGGGGQVARLEAQSTIVEPSAGPMIELGGHR